MSTVKDSLNAVTTDCKSISPGNSFLEFEMYVSNPNHKTKGVSIASTNSAEVFFRPTHVQEGETQWEDEDAVDSYEFISALCKVEHANV